MTESLILQGSIFKNNKPDPADTFAGEFLGLKFWQGWCDNGDDCFPDQINTVLMNGKLYTWFGREKPADAAARIRAGDFEIWINRPVGKLKTKFEAGRLS